MKLYIVAGEPSGDLLAAGLMKALRRIAPGVEFRGVGGEAMTTVGNSDCSGLLRVFDPRNDDTSPSLRGGLQARRSNPQFSSLFDISEISVMGLFEVLPRLPLILKRINQTIKDIEEFAPDVVVTVDSWGFVSELITKLRRRAARTGNTLPPMIHYVAPQVWAWKKGRAKNVARLVDRLMTLLPNEGQYFEKYGLLCDFVGHPVVERIAQADLDPEGFRAANGIPPEATVVSLLPGSRHSEVKRLLPVLKEAVIRVAASFENLYLVVPTVATVADEVKRGFEDFPIPVRVVTGEMNRYNAFATSVIAISKSGTVSLELAAIGVPHLIAYKFNTLTNIAIGLAIKVRFANLVNLLADREIIPEFVLGNCRADLIADCATKLLAEPDVAARQVVEARKVMQMLRLPDVLPSDRAAQIVAEEGGMKRAHT